MRLGQGCRFPGQARHTFLVRINLGVICSVGLSMEGVSIWASLLLVLALLIIAAAGPDLTNNLLFLAVLIGFVYVPRVARMMRATAIEIVTRDFVAIARTRGESAWSIMWRELLPNATSTLLVEFAVRGGAAVVVIGSLGFLGFGARPPIPEWGLMISENRDVIVAAPHTVVAPGIAVASLVIGLNLFSEGLARILGRSVQRGG